MSEMSIYSVAVLKLKTNWTVIYRHESTCICPQTLRSSENPRGEINDLCFLKHIPQALDEFPMRWVLIDIVIPIGGAVVLNYKGVGDATLHPFRGIVYTARRGFDVWLLRCRMDAFVLQSQHARTNIFDDFGGRVSFELEKDYMGERHGGRRIGKTGAGGMEGPNYEAKKDRSDQETR